MVIREITNVPIKKEELAGESHPLLTWRTHSGFQSTLFSSRDIGFCRGCRLIGRRHSRRYRTGRDFCNETGRIGEHAMLVHVEPFDFFLLGNP